MKQTTGWLLVAALSASGCTIVSGPGGRLPDDKGFDPLVVRTPQPKLPNVFVLNGYLVVDQEPIRLWPRDYNLEGRTARIEWALAANSDTQWPKPEEAISFSPDPKGRLCEVRGKDRKVLSCTLPYREHAKYKYTLKVVDEKIKPPPLDPNIVNME
jgi:hypothetical protein